MAQRNVWLADGRMSTTRLSQWRPIITQGPIRKKVRAVRPIGKDFDSSLPHESLYKDLGKKLKLDSLPLFFKKKKKL